jgi:hypothetical protein
MVFKGQYESEIFEEYKEWRHWISNIFLPLINTENGDFIHFPYEGGILDQGYISMEILYLLQQCYRKVQYEKMKKMRG